MKEKEILLRLLENYRRLNTNAEEAKKVVGKYQPPGVSPTEASAWVALCRTILNLDEFITRE